MKQRRWEPVTKLEPLPPLDKSLVAALERARTLKEQRTKRTKKRR